MQEAIGYLRVSTKEQGRSGLGLAAQRSHIRSFGRSEGFLVRRWYQDIQTGAGADALLLRPGLASALKEAKSAHYPLIVSRLDRLSRNVHFITGLMEHKVHFVVAALGRDCDNFTLHIYASIAEQERKLTSERSRAAAAVLKLRGKRYGLETRSKASQARLRVLAAAAQQRAADERAEACRMVIEWALKLPGIGGRPITIDGAANALNRRGILTPRGGRWYGVSVKAMTRRLGIDHPSAQASHQSSRRRVYEVWKQHPDVTRKQVLAALNSEYPVGICLTHSLLRDFRETAAARSALYKKTDWPLDCRTTLRVQISDIWKKRPQITAEELIDELPTAKAVSRIWIEQVLRICKLVSGTVHAIGWRNARRAVRRRPSKRKPGGAL